MNQPCVSFASDRNIYENKCVYLNVCTSDRVWPRGPMDKASDFESEDCGFESHRGRYFLSSYTVCTNRDKILANM